MKNEIQDVIEEDSVLDEEFCKIGARVRHVGHGRMRGCYTPGLGWEATIVVNGFDDLGNVRCRLPDGEERAWSPKDLVLIQSAGFGEKAK